MGYTVVIENKAQKEFLRIPAPHCHTIKTSIDRLENSPRPANVKKLTGTSDGYRVRAGDYRILYTIDDRKKIVTIYRIRHRREVYR